MPVPAVAPHFRLDIPHHFRGLQVLSFSGVQAISQPFAFELEVLIDAPFFDPQNLMFRAAFLAIAGAKNGIHGQIHGVVRSHFRPGPACYRITLGARLACLGLRHNQRVFQGMTAVQIIRHVLNEHGMQPDSFRFDLSRECCERAHCEQYRESDLQLLQRLCAEEGIHYHFWHSPQRHELVFGDSLRVFRRAPDARYQHASHQPGVRQFSVTSDVGEDPTRRCLQRAEGESTLPFVSAGQLLPLRDHPEVQWNHFWLVSEVRHRGFDPRQLQSATGNEPPLYVNHFKALPWDAAFKPPPVVRECVAGIQRAWVIGKPGEPVQPDAKGRVWAQLECGFQGQGATFSACWLPVKNELRNRLCGGMQVLVSFMKGNRDRPLISACQVPLSAVEKAAPRPAGTGGRIQARLVLGDERWIELDGGPHITFKDDCELAFKVGDSVATVDAAGLKLLSGQILFVAREDSPQ